MSTSLQTIRRCEIPIVARLTERRKWYLDKRDCEPAPHETPHNRAVEVTELPTKRPADLKYDCHLSLTFQSLALLTLQETVVPAIARRRQYRIAPQALATP